MTRWNKELYDPIVRRLFDKGRPPKTILEFMLDCRYAVSLRDVRNAIKRLGLERPAPRPTPWEGPVANVGRLNPMDEARRLLNERLTERNGTYCLDGRDVNLVAIMWEVNRIRMVAGLDQLDGNPTWVVSLI